MGIPPCNGIDFISAGWYTILADALNAIEGVPVSDYAKALSLCWANGELTGEQMKAALLASHRKMAEQERRAHA